MNITHYHPPQTGLIMISGITWTVLQDAIHSSLALPELLDIDVSEVLNVPELNLVTRSQRPRCNSL